jgi:lipoyl(octanoyl) transferase
MIPIQSQWLGRISWQAAYELQEQMLERRLNQEIPDTLLLLEHEPVITIGRTPDRSSLQAAEMYEVPVIETNRGGQATYHGPGQLVAYLIFDLSARVKDLHLHLRQIEDQLLHLCDHYGVKAERRDSLTGVWVAQRKLASIGVGVRRWVTMHGLALNVSAESLSGFTHIVPCGIAGVQMTSLSQEAGRSLSVEEVAHSLAALYAEQPHA